MCNVVQCAVQGMLWWITCDMIKRWEQSCSHYSRFSAKGFCVSNKRLSTGSRRIDKMAITRLPIDSKTPDVVVYQKLAAFVLSPGKLQEFGFVNVVVLILSRVAHCFHRYPKMESASGVAGNVIIPPLQYAAVVSDFSSNKRKCQRCRSVFQVKSDGTPVTWEKCLYPGGGRSGTQVSDCHAVHGFNHRDYKRNFVQTKQRGDDASSAGVFALDTEMVMFWVVVKHVVERFVCRSRQRLEEQRLK